MKTNRGFELQHFMDDYGVDCSLQESSAWVPHIWLGVHRPIVRIMYKDAVANGLNLEKNDTETNENGWCDFPIPKEAMIDSRMHLTRSQAAELAEKLLFFARNGYLEEDFEAGTSMRDIAYTNKTTHQRIRRILLDDGAYETIETIYAKKQLEEGADLNTIAAELGMSRNEVISNAVKMSSFV